MPKIKKSAEILLSRHNWSRGPDTDCDLVFRWRCNNTSGSRAKPPKSEVGTGAPWARPSPHPFLSLTIISGYYPIISAMSGTSWPSESLYKACLAPGTPTNLISYSDTLIISPWVGNIADLKKNAVISLFLLSRSYQFCIGKISDTSLCLMF